jgi:hypothetical protein
MPVSDDGAIKVGVCVPDKLPAAVDNKMGLHGFDVAKQSLQYDLMMEGKTRGFWRPKDLIVNQNAGIPARTKRPISSDRI